MANNWDDEFSSFDFDLSKPSKPADTDEMSTAVKDTSSNFENFDSPVATDVPTESEEIPKVVVNSEPTADTESIPPPAEEEDGIDMDTGFAEADEKWHKSEERLKEQKERNPFRSNEPKLQDPMEPAMKLIETAEQLDQRAEAVEAMMKQVEQAVENGGQPPKGTRSALRRMDDYVLVMRAAKTIVETLSKTARQEVFETLKNSRFLSVFNQIKRDGKRKDAKMKATIGEIETALGNGDHEEANAIARLLKQQAMHMQDNASELAVALCEATSNYPEEDGQLALFSKIADEGDADSMACIDHAMRLTGQVVVPVDEAKAMLEARANGDQQTIDDILDRVITRLVEDEKL